MKRFVVLAAMVMMFVFGTITSYAGNLNVDRIKLLSRNVGEFEQLREDGIDFSVTYTNNGFVLEAFEVDEDLYYTKIVYDMVNHKVVVYDGEDDKVGMESDWNWEDYMHI